MPAKLVRVGADPPIEHTLSSFNSLGSHPDNSIVLDPPALAEHATIVRCLEEYSIHGVDGWADVNGQRTGERVLNSGDVITLGGATFRIVIEAAPSTTPRIVPAWTYASSQAVGRVVSLHRGRYAVAHAGILRRKSRLLTHDGERWHVFAEVPGRLHDLSELGDGSLIAGGAGECWHGRPGQMRPFSHPGAAPVVAAWGPSARCIYALSAEQLSHFDGERWQTIDLAARGVVRDTGNGHVLWAAGACDRTGRCWLGGADMKHSSLVTSDGATWQRVGGTGIGALTGLACGADGTMFVVGGGMTSGLWPVGRAPHRVEPERASLSVETDDRWPTYGGEWRALDGYRAFPHFTWPLLVRCCEVETTRVVVVGAPKDGARELPVFLDDRWVLVAVPELPRHGAPIDVTRDGRLTFADDTNVWVSSPLFELLGP